ncbi:MAG: methylated-DNA--[protein]-cysteine S-methyltransferase [Sphingobacteriaceae bacterium]|nr:methylated-DNA--[protein]-cysteine S-methyltransferase [Sphingobacteriaceae bacterium]
MSEHKLYYDYVDTPLGELELTSSSQHLLSVLFVKTEKNVLDKQPVLPSPINDEAKKQLTAYFKKEITQFNLPLNAAGTDFQKSVWNELLKIPFGTTISYLTLAKKLGDPNSIRAAASANGKNPITIIIPCHRVIGADGKLVGYSGDIYRKQWLLDHESKQEKLF